MTESSNFDPNIKTNYNIPEGKFAGVDPGSGYLLFRTESGELKTYRIKLMKGKEEVALPNKERLANDIASFLNTKVTKETIKDFNIPKFTISQKSIFTGSKTVILSDEESTSLKSIFDTHLPPVETSEETVKKETIEKKPWKIFQWAKSFFSFLGLWKETEKKTEKKTDEVVRKFLSNKDYEINLEEQKKDEEVTDSEDERTESDDRYVGDDLNFLPIENLNEEKQNEILNKQKEEEIEKNKNKKVENKNVEDDSILEDALQTYEELEEQLKNEGEKKTIEKKE